MRETGRLGARDLCAGRSPPGAVLARPAIRDFPAAIAAGRGQAAAAPLSAPHKGRVERPSPYVIPTSVWHGFFGRTPVRSVVNRQAASAPGIAAQPVKKPKACPAVRGAAD